ncbi:MAG: MFS transporter [Anaerolineae bacterium]|nr:MFS transporter [Anaerolineae bacterium]
MSGYIQLLRGNPNYTRLWIAQAISLLGDWFSTIALSTLIVLYVNERDAGFAVSLLLLSRFLPPLLVGPIAGVLVDRLNRKALLLISDTLRTVIVLVFLLVNAPDRLWLIYVLSFLQFSLSALFDPARSAILPSLVKPDDLVRANMLGSATWSVMLAAGAAIGGLVSAGLGTGPALVIDAASFAVSALFIASIRWRPQDQHAHKAHDKTELGFRDGLRYIARHPARSTALLIKLGGSFGSVDTIMVIYATKLFIIGENGNGSLGILYTAFGIGSALGPILLNRFNNGSIHKMRQLIIVGYACIAFGWFLFGGAPTLLFAGLALMVKAIGSSIYWTYSSVIIQKVTPDKFLGRMFSLDMWGFQLATVISAVLTGWAIDQVGVTGVRNVVIATGFASLVPLVLWTLALPWIERQDTIVPTPVIEADLANR